MVCITLLIDIDSTLVVDIASALPPMRRSSFTKLKAIVRDLICKTEKLLDESEYQHYKMMGRRIKKWSDQKEAFWMQ